MIKARGKRTTTTRDGKAVDTHHGAIEDLVKAGIMFVGTPDDVTSQLAEFVDSRMREISSGTLTVDSLKVAILAALHIADELHRLKNMHEQADAQLAARSAECAEMLDRLLKVRTTLESEQGSAGKLTLG